MRGERCSTELNTYFVSGVWKAITVANRVKRGLKDGIKN
jgi:hypothetical protein